MSYRLTTYLIAFSLVSGTPAMAQLASGIAGSAADKAIAQKALGIVEDIHGSWTEMPRNIATHGMTPGALIGNGSVGVALGGSAERQQYYVGRNDYWSVQRGKIMPVGRLEFSFPALAGATVQLRENIGAADITGAFAAGTSQLRSHAWVGLEQELLLRGAGEHRGG